MGCVCCCFSDRDPEDSSNDRSCVCVNSLIHTILNKYKSLFRENQISTLCTTNNVQGAISSTSNVPPENVTSLLRLDPEKVGGGLIKYSEQLSNSGYISLEHVKGELIQKCRLDTSLKSSEDEDVCPTCLEEYTSENPRTIMQCSHHYHLSCIYEWMERSATCPLCGKVMLFDETT
ncbi:hypothetical protein ACOSP7_017856 [Xanthoceras sorbifolium]